MSNPTMRYDILSDAEVAAEKFVAYQRQQGRDVSDDERAQYVADYLEARAEHIEARAERNKGPN